MKDHIMRFKMIGSDQTQVSAIGVGCMGLGGYFNRDNSSDVEALSTLRLAFDQGRNLADTAEVYADGHSEELVGQAIEGRRDKIYVATKVSPEHLDQANLIRSAEGSLKRLKTDYIDLYQIHWPNPKISMEETLGAMETLVRTGKVRHIGLSNFSLKEIQEARKSLETEVIASVQAEYNLFDRSIESALLPYCQEHGIAVIAYSPLDQGHICGGPHRRSQLAPIAAHYGCTVAQLALAWLIRRPSVIAIPKASNPEHVIANATAGEFELSPEDADAIDRITSVNLVEIPVDSIRVISHDTERKVYRTLKEAKENIYGFTPSPLELAENIRTCEFLKAIRVRPTYDPQCGYDFDLIEGRIRYWAWVIAFDGENDIPALIRE